MRVVGRLSQPPNRIQSAVRQHQPSGRSRSYDVEEGIICLADANYFPEFVFCITH